jgi:hypothetical protein
MTNDYIARLVQKYPEAYAGAFILTGSTIATLTHR